MRLIATWALAAAILTAGLTDSAVATAANVAPAKTATKTKTAEKSWRFVTRRGVLRVWRPKNYDRRTAGIVVYVHGFDKNVDVSWKDHRLAAKFRASKRNALFIVPKAPIALNKPVAWPSLPGLISTSLRLAKLKRPKGPIVVVGYSGGYLTVIRWLNYKRLHHIVLIDGLYACVPFFDKWLYRSKARAANRLVTVAFDTIKWADPWVKRAAGSVTLTKIPLRFREFSKRARAAKLLYMRSQYPHLALADRDDIVPMLLRLAPLRRL